MMIDEVEELNTANVVFRGSSSGIITTSNPRVGKKRSPGLKPEQIDGEVVVNVRPGHGQSDELFSSQDPSAQNIRCKQQTIYD